MPPLDVPALVLRNAHLSPDYNVLHLEAPAIAAASQPGQFVMIRTAAGTDPLLRRPFSVFEVLRDAAGSPSGISVLCKRIGPGTARLYDAAAGDRLSVLGPLGKPFSLVLPPAEAWMVAGGVGLAPFATLTEALMEHRRAQRACSTAAARAPISSTWTGSPRAACRSTWRPRTDRSARTAA